jgi:hypothetical protein
MGPGERQKNLIKHRVAFSEAASVFDDDFSITIFDPDRSEIEERYLIIGISALKRLLMVAHTDRGDRIRIISARELTRTEEKAYEEEIKRRKRR